MKFTSRVLVESQTDLPLVDVQIAFPRGASEDPIGREGLAHHGSELMTKGAAGRDREALDEAFEALGASIDVNVSHDDVTVSTHCLSRNLEAVLALVGDVLLRPRMEESEHDKLVQDELSGIDQVREDDGSLAWRFFQRAALPDHPYGRSVLGTEESIEAVTVEEARAWRTANLRADEVVVGLGGDVDPDVAMRLASRLVEELPSGPAPRAPCPTMTPLPPARRTIVVDKPERVQCQLVIGHVTPPRAHPDWLPLHVASTVLGGMFTSRLMSEVRVKRGWSYDASARMGRARAGHAFRIRCAPAQEQTPDTLALVLQLFEELVRDGITGDELIAAIGYLEGRHAFQIDTAAHRLDLAIDEVVLGLAPGTFARLPEALREISLDQVNAAARRHFAPDRAIVLITATAEGLLPRLDPAVTGPVEVLEYDSY